jgi:hypothetical protein
MLRSAAQDLTRTICIPKADFTKAVKIWRPESGARFTLSSSVLGHHVVPTCHTTLCHNTKDYNVNWQKLFWKDLFSQTELTFI